MCVSIIIVNWNSKDLLRKCLLSLDRFKPAFPVEVVVVDSGSYDGCASMLVEEFPSVKFVQSTENIGFARSNNLGFAHAKGKAILLLNPDTELTEDSLTSLYFRVCTLPGAGAVGCRLVTGKGALLSHSVQRFPTIFNRGFESDFLRKMFPRSKFWDAMALERDVPSEVDGVSGACMMLKRECFEKVEGFAECYFMYGEDIDLSFRVWRAGFRIYHVPETTVIHHVGGSSGKASQHFATVMMSRSRFTFMKQHRGTVSAWAYRAAMAVCAIGRMALIPVISIAGRDVIPDREESFGKWKAILYWSLGRSNI